jgi:hypothetical protein
VSYGSRSFAAQYLACEKLLGLNRGAVNVNGSGITPGHPGWLHRYPDLGNPAA